MIALLLTEKANVSLLKSENFIKLINLINTKPALFNTYYNSLATEFSEVMSLKDISCRVLKHHENLNEKMPLELFEYYQDTQNRELKRKIYSILDNSEEMLKNKEQINKI